MKKQSKNSEVPFERIFFVDRVTRPWLLYFAIHSSYAYGILNFVLNG